MCPSEVGKEPDRMVIPNRSIRFSWAGYQGSSVQFLL
jgi:hypothetical protein